MIDWLETPTHLPLSTMVLLALLFAGAYIFGQENRWVRKKLG